MLDIVALVLSLWVWIHHALYPPRLWTLVVNNTDSEGLDFNAALDEVKTEVLSRLWNSSCYLTEELKGRGADVGILFYRLGAVRCHNKSLKAEIIKLKQSCCRNLIVVFLLFQATDEDRSVEKFVEVWVKEKKEKYGIKAIFQMTYDMKTVPFSRPQNKQEMEKLTTFIAEISRSATKQALMTYLKSRRQNNCFSNTRLPLSDLLRFLYAIVPHHLHQKLLMIMACLEEMLPYGVFAALVFDSAAMKRALDSSVLNELPL